MVVLLIYNPFQKWEYMHEPKANSPEEKLMKVLKEPRDWIKLEKETAKRSAA